MRARLTVLALAMSLIAAPAARAGIYQQVLGAYERYGSVPACQFTSAQLQAALQGVDTYGTQYFQDFTNAVQSARAERASGACAPPSAHGNGAAVKGSGGISLPPSPTAAGGGGIPGPLALMGILLALGVAGLGIVRLGSALGWEPGWAAAWRHGMDEAAFRMAGRLDGWDERLRSHRRRSPR